MKINIEVDVSPEEARELLGLPDVKALQQTVLSQMGDRLKNSVEQGDAVAQTLLTGAIEPWKLLAKMVTAAGEKSASSSDSPTGSKSKS